MNKKVFHNPLVKVFLLLFLIPVSFSGSFTSRLASADEKNCIIVPQKEYADVKKEILNLLQKYHYKRIPIDDDFSDSMFERYLLDLDPTRSYFLKSDIEKFGKCRKTLDDELLSGSLDCGYDIFNTYYKKAFQQNKKYSDNMASFIESMQFDTTETFDVSRDNASWAVTDSELEDIWFKRLKANALNLSLAGKTSEEISETLEKRYKNQLNQLKQITSEDVFQTFMNSFTRMFDPHSAYFSPRQTENFNISMRLSLEGIGAVLQLENEYTKVLRLVPGGPADKSKQIKPGDLIVSVGQGAEGELVDVVGWRLDDVVELIRGAKGTTVRLEIIPSDAKDIHIKKLVSIVRDTVKLEEQAAQKKIIKIERNGKKHTIGVISIPAFYMDFKALKEGDPYYRSTTLDVQNIVNELKLQNVEGIVVDLRYNSGGLLQEAVALTGLFIPTGAVVQVKSSDDKVEILEDPFEGVIYNGPLAVVINRLSASASEIFAGAIQDYKRGIIIGEQSFGKGTVQALQPMSMGQLKYTTAMFYRVTGKSTQNRGVIPDIVYPSLYDSTKIGESTLVNALPWGSIESVEYHPVNIEGEVLNRVIELHKERIKNDPDYIYITEMKQHLDSVRNRTEISLSEKARLAERDRAEKIRKDIENRRRKALGLPLVEEADEIVETSVNIVDNDGEENKSDEPDPVLIEAGNVLIDFTKCLLK